MYYLLNGLNYPDFGYTLNSGALSCVNSAMKSVALFVLGKPSLNLTLEVVFRLLVIVITSSTSGSLDSKLALNLNGQNIHAWCLLPSATMSRFRYNYVSTALKRLVRVEFSKISQGLSRIAQSIFFRIKLDPFMCDLVKFFVVEIYFKLKLLIRVNIGYSWEIEHQNGFFFLMTLYDKFIIYRA